MVLLGSISLGFSRVSSQDISWRCSHRKARLGLEVLIPEWFIHMADKFIQDVVRRACNMDFSLGLLKWPHDMAASLLQSE